MGSSGPGVGPTGQYAVYVQHLDGARRSPASDDSRWDRWGVEWQGDRVMAAGTDWQADIDLIQRGRKKGKDKWLYMGLAYWHWVVAAELIRSYRRWKCTGGSAGASDASLVQGNKRGGQVGGGNWPLGGSLLPGIFHGFGASMEPTSGLSKRGEVGAIWAGYMRINPLHWGAPN